MLFVFFFQISASQCIYVYFTKWSLISQYDCKQNSIYDSHNLLDLLCLFRSRMKVYFWHWYLSFQVLRDFNSCYLGALTIFPIDVEISKNSALIHPTLLARILEPALLMVGSIVGSKCRSDGCPSSFFGQFCVRLCESIICKYHIDMKTVCTFYIYTFLIINFIINF